MENVWSATSSSSFAFLSFIRSSSTQVIYWSVVTFPLWLSLIFYLFYPQLFVIGACYFLTSLVLWFFKNFRLLALAKGEVLSLFVSSKIRKLKNGIKEKKRICVVGAGSAGLVTVKECAEAGHEVVCYEQSKTYGGTFAYDSDRTGSCWASCHFVSSPYSTCFSDFEPPLHLRSPKHTQHWSWSQYLDYLSCYIKHYKLEKNIHFEYKVLDIIPMYSKSTTDNKEIRDTGHNTYKVILLNLKTQKQTEIEYDHVAVCTGLVAKPNLPLFLEDKVIDKANGESKIILKYGGFKGDVVHSNQYKTPDRFEGKRVLIIGIGESGSDLVGEIAPVTENCFLSIRRGTWIIPRLNPVTKIYNDYDTTRLRYSTPRIIQNIIVWFLYCLEKFWGQLTPAGLLKFELLQHAKTWPFNMVATKSDSLLEPLLSGKCKMKPAVLGIKDGMIEFTDGSKEVIDTIVLATGYKANPNFDSLPFPGINKLYKKMFYPEYGCGVGYIGFARPSIGAIPPIMEMQARWFSLQCSRASLDPLPHTNLMNQSIIQNGKQQREEYGICCDRLPATVSYIRYMDEIAEEIGCRPDPWWLFRHPSLLWQIITGPFIPCIYRLSSHDPLIKQQSINIIKQLPRTWPLSYLCVSVFWSIMATVPSTLGIRSLNHQNTVV